MVVALVAVVIFGLLHGIEPAHGWPIALFYAASKKRPLLQGFLSSGLMAGAHFTSSIVAVVVYLVVIQFVALPLMILKYVAAVLLVILAVRFWLTTRGEAQHGHVHETLEKLEHSHEHSHGNTGLHVHQHTHEAKIMTLRGLLGFAFLVGFAHEEEFALLALAVGGVDPFLLIVSYASAVTVSLVAITMVSVRTYGRFRDKLQTLDKYTAKLTSIILLGLAVALLLNLA